MTAEFAATLDTWKANGWIEKWNGRFGTSTLKDKTIKIAAGREGLLKDFQALAFMAGVNGMLIGGYLTVKGRGVAEDHKLIKEIKKVWRE